MKSAKGIVAAATATAASGCILLLALFFPVKQRVERVLAKARGEGGSVHDVRVLETPRRRIDVPPRPGLLALTSTRDMRDGIAARGKLLVASSGGVLVHDEAGHLERIMTWEHGLGSTITTALAEYRGMVAVGTADGSVTLLDAEDSRVARFQIGDAKEAAVTELVADGDMLYVGTSGLGLIAWDGRTAVATSFGDGREPPDITALARGPSGLAVGTSSGVLLRRGSGYLAPLDRGEGRKERVTALAWNGDALLVGTPFGLSQREAEGTWRKLLDGVLVTAILSDAVSGRLYVGTFDQGVIVLSPSGGERRLLGQERINRLRWVGDRPVAFGSGGAWDLSGHVATLLVPTGTSALSGPHVTALLHHGGAIWVGTQEDGVDVLRTDGSLSRHFPRPGFRKGASKITHLETLGETAGVLVSTREGILRVDSHGADDFRPSGERIPHEDVRAAAQLSGLVAVATTRGVAVYDPGGAVKTLTQREGLPDDQALAIAWGEGGRLFVGTRKGLAIFTRDMRLEKVVAPSPSGIGSAVITALAAANEGMYVGTHGGGVALVGEDGLAVNVSLELHDLVINPGALVLDRDRLHACTRGEGLLVLDRTTRRWRKLGEPLGSDNVTAVLPTDDALWIGTDRGLVKISRSLVEAALAPLPRS
ncbi:MAG: hypothetical protein HY698_02920 [Deltaproteobacteria bacterium]|nr:hypothetical protein [Deltaproteobacteria bacterium]